LKKHNLLQNKKRQPSKFNTQKVMANNIKSHILLNSRSNSKLIRNSTCSKI